MTDLYLPCLAGNENAGLSCASVSVQRTSNHHPSRPWVYQPHLVSADIPAQGYGMQSSCPESRLLFLSFRDGTMMILCRVVARIRYWESRSVHSSTRRSWVPCSVPPVLSFSPEFYVPSLSTRIASLGLDSARAVSWHRDSYHPASRVEPTVFREV